MRWYVIALIIFSHAFAHARPTERKMEVEVRPLNATEASLLNSDRTKIKNYASARGTSVHLRGNKRDIPTLHTLLEHGPYSPDLDGELKAFGTAFGDIIENEIGLHWVSLTDEHGTDVALQYKTFSVYVFPRDMLIKRSERGENMKDINLEFMLNQLKETVHEQVIRSNAK